MGNLASSGTPRVSNCLLTDPSRSRHPHLPARRASSSASSTVRPGSHPPTRPGRRAPCARATRRGTQRQDPARGSSRAGRGPEAHAALARAVGRLREVGRPLGHLAIVASPGRAAPARCPQAPARISSRLTGGCRFQGTHDGCPWGPQPRNKFGPSVRVISSSQAHERHHPRRPCEPAFHSSGHEKPAT